MNPPINETEQREHSRAMLTEVARELPPEVVELRFELEDDSTGDPSIFLWVAMPESSKGEEIWAADRTRAIRDILFQGLRERLPERWPYIRFTTPGQWPPTSLDIPRAA